MNTFLDLPASITQAQREYLGSLNLITNDKFDLQKAVNLSQNAIYTQPLQSFINFANTVIAGKAIGKRVGLTKKKVSDLISQLNSNNVNKFDVLTDTESIVKNKAVDLFEKAQDKAKVKQIIAQNQAKIKAARNKLRIRRTLAKQAALKAKTDPSQINFAAAQKQLQAQQQAKRQVKQDLVQNYKATLQQLIQMAVQNKNNQTVVQLQKFQKNLLNDLSFESVIPVYQREYRGIFDQAIPNSSLDKFKWGKKKNFQVSGWKSRDGIDLSDLKYSKQLDLLPDRAPNFVTKWLTQQYDKRQEYSKSNSVFQKSLGQKARQKKISLGQLVLNESYWKDNDPPQGFQWDKQRGQLVYVPQNPHVRQLWASGIGYKQVPSIQQFSDKLNFLQSTYKTASQSKQAFDKDLVYIVSGAKALGFNPHFGAISKNSPSLYIGAFIDPLTGNIRLPPKPQFTQFNPVDRTSMMQYKVMKAIYTWNANVKAMQQLKKFVSQTQKGWKTVVKNKRKNANVLERTRNQYKNIARKIALKMPIWGIQSTNQQYKQMEKVYANPASTQSQLIQATQTFANRVSGANKKVAQMSVTNWLNGTGKVNYGALLRGKAAGNFAAAPIEGSKDFLKRTFIKAKKLGDTDVTVQQDSIYKNYGDSNLGIDYQRLKKIKGTGAFQSLSSLRSNQNYTDFDLSNPFHLGANKSWQNAYQQDQNQDPKKRVNRTMNLYRFAKQRPQYVTPNWNLDRNIVDEMKNAYEYGIDKVQELRNTILDQDTMARQNYSKTSTMKDEYKNAVNYIQDYFNSDDWNLKQIKNLASILFGYQLKDAEITNLKKYWDQDKEKKRSYWQSRFLYQLLQKILMGSIIPTGIASRTRSKAVNRQAYQPQMYNATYTQKPKRRGAP